MARPLKDGPERLSYRSNFRLTPSEGQQLEADAQAAGLTVSDHVRQVVLQSAPLFPKATPERAFQIKALGLLGYIRSDLNQILKDRFAHAFIDRERSEKVLNDIQDIAALLHKLLEKP